MEKPKIKEVIIVEGRYDVNQLKQCVEADVIETSGFQIFSNKEKIALIRLLSEKRGIIIMTDSDKAGFLIRNHLKGMLAGCNIKHAYIPDIYGKERRKTVRSKEGKLGVEGMSSTVIIESLKRCGAEFENSEKSLEKSDKITKADLYAYGLSGGANSSEKRSQLIGELNLPENITTNLLLEVINILYDKHTFEELLSSATF